MMNNEDQPWANLLRDLMTYVSILKVTVSFKQAYNNCSDWLL